MRLKDLHRFLAWQNPSELLYVAVSPQAYESLLSEYLAVSVENCQAVSESMLEREHFLLAGIPVVQARATQPTQVIT